MSVESSNKADVDLSSKEKDQLSFQQSAFDALERDFRDVLNELVGDKTLERFRIEYEKLHSTLKRSHENEKRLVKKCRQLNSEIVANATKIQTALRLSLQDQHSINLLKKEIDKAWRMVDGAQEKEKRARENVQRLKTEIANLTRLVDQGAGLSLGQENTVNELLRRKEELQALVATNANVILENERKVEELTTERELLEHRRYETEKELLNLKEKNIKIRNEAQREIRIADRLEQERLTIQELNDKHKFKHVEKQKKIEEITRKFSEQESLLNIERKTLEGMHRAAEVLKQQNTDHERDVQAMTEVNKKLLADTEHLEKKLSVRNKEVYTKQNAVHAQTLKIARLEKDNETIRSRKEEAEKYRDWLKEEMKQVMKSVENQKKDVDTDEAVIAELSRHVKQLENGLKQAEEKNVLQFRLVNGHEKLKEALHNDIKAHKDEEISLRKKNYNLEKQREKQSMNASQWHTRYQDAMRTLKLKEMEIADMDKQVADEQQKLIAQRKLYQQVRSDRNEFSKKQVESEDEIAEMKKKFKIMSHQIDQLKEEIQQKDNALINAHFSYKRLQDGVKRNKRKLAKRKEVLYATDSALETQDTEIKNIRKTLRETENLQKHQKKIYDAMVKERDILGTQLIRRNDELALIYEKLRIQQHTLNEGEVAHRERVEDIQGEKLELNNLKRMLQIRSKQVTNIEGLKNEVYSVQRELLQERTKVKALSEELENPANVHRWRRLKGTDRKRGELLEQISTLQKRLIIKTEEVVEKELLLQEKEKLYDELNALLERQPGSEIAEQLSAFQHELRDKTRKMKSMAAELNMFQAQVIEYRYEAERLQRTSQNVKRQFFEHKRREQMREEWEHEKDQQDDEGQHTTTYTSNEDDTKYATNDDDDLEEAYEKTTKIQKQQPQAI